MKSPDRGEIWIVDLGMTAKVRPCLVISIPVEDENGGLVTLVPHTTSPRGSRFEVAVRHRALKAGVFDAQNLVTISHAKLVRRLGTIPHSDLADVESTVRLWLGLK